MLFCDNLVLRILPHPTLDIKAEDDTDNDYDEVDAPTKDPAADSTVNSECIISIITTFTLVIAKLSDYIIL